jgi:hypothetical protein
MAKEQSPMNYWLLVLAMVLLLLAVFGRWPQGFYTLLRLVVCISAVYAATKMLTAKMQRWAWGMGGIALVFNPVLPLYFSRDTWAVLDLLAAIFTAICMLVFHKRAAVN